MKTTLLITLSLLALCLADIELSTDRIYQAETVVGKLTYFSFRMVPTDYHYILYTKTKNESHFITYNIKYGEKPTQTDFHEQIRFSDQRNVTKRGFNSKYYIGVFNHFAHHPSLKFEIGLMMVKKLESNARVRHPVGFPRTAYVTYEDPQRITLTTFNLSITCYGSATVYIGNSWVWPNRWNNATSYVIPRNGFRNIIFNHTTHVKFSIYGPNGGGCSFEYKPIKTYIDSMIQFTRPSDRNELDYFATKITTNSSYTDAFILAKHGEYLDFYANVGSDPAKIPLPTPTNHQFKSERVEGRNGYLGNLMPVKRGQYVIYGVHGGKPGQTYDFAPNSYYYRLGFTDPTMFRLTRDEPRVFSVTNHGFGPFFMKFFCDFFVQSKVTLKVRYNGVVRTIAESRDGIDFKYETMDQGVTYDFIFEGEKNIISMVTDGWGQSK